MPALATIVAHCQPNYTVVSLNCCRLYIISSMTLVKGRTARQVYLFVILAGGGGADPGPELSEAAPISTFAGSTEVTDRPKHIRRLHQVASFSY